jgi:hypothetical protein
MPTAINGSELPPVNGNSVPPCDGSTDVDVTTLPGFVVVVEP